MQICVLGLLPFQLRCLININIKGIKNRQICIVYITVSELGKNIQWLSVLKTFYMF